MKPVKLRLKIDLVSYPARAEGLVNSTLIREREDANQDLVIVKKKKKKKKRTSQIIDITVSVD